MIAPTVAAITLNPTGGGVAAVSRLLWRAVQEDWGSRAQLLTMFDQENHPATFMEKTRFTAALARLEALEHTDFVLFTHLALAQVQHTLPARLRRPYGVFLHGIEAWNALGGAGKRALAGASVRLANSAYTARRVSEAHPEVGAIEVCALALPESTEIGSDPIQIDPRPTSDGVTATLGRHVVLAVGRLLRAERYKGHDQLIDAWPAIVNRVPDAQLVIVGDGDDAGRLRRKAARSSAGERVLFTGFVPETTLETLYRRAAIFALPSSGEGFGIVYLEAMAHRLPCIGSLHDAAGEVIVDGQTGRLVSQNDISGIANAITTLLLDEGERRRMGDAGHRRLRAEFSFDRFRRRISSLLPAETATAGAGAFTTSL